ncbi:MAG: sortase [Anaerolineae bacterium]|jgi:LPXTG-site transpeptidase (sortase) family protein|nr:sortase [Anaerolineae bacterium]
MDPTDFTNPSGQTFPAPIQDTIRVSDFWIEKSFSHSPITRGGKTVLTVTLHNDNIEPITNGNLTDRFDTMGGDEFLLADPMDFSTTCPAGSTSSVPGDDRFHFENFQMDPTSSCTFSVTIEAQATASMGNTNRNRIATSDASVEWNNIPGTHPPRSNADARVVIEDMDIDLVKKFDPSAVFGGSPSQMTITLINPNDVALEDITFTDNMPVGMVITDPMGIDTTTCGGTVDVAVDRRSFTFSGGYLSPNRQCQVKINATLTENLNLVNTIPAGAVSTFIGVTNPFPASSTLSNLPGVSVSKFFNPNEVKINEVSLLTIQIANSSPTAPVTNMGIYDLFPSGLIIAPSPAPINTCGGSLTTGIDAGNYYVELSGASLAIFQDPGGGDVCQIIVPVYAENPAAYKNTIPENSIVADDGVTNVLPTEDTLIVVGTPALEIVKNVTSTGPYVAGSTVNYEIIVTSTGDIPITNVTVTDPTPGVVMGTCTPAQGATLAPTEQMTCSATYVLTNDDITAGSFTNTAAADSDETDPVEDDETVVLNGSPSMSVTKSTTSIGPYSLGDTITYQIVVRNTGEVTLNNVQVTDPGTGVVLGGCIPALGSSLAPTERMTCTATHVVTQTDVDAAVYSNTAVGDSDETGPESDTVDVPISNFPVLGVYKFQTTSGPFELGDTITYTIAVKNEGNTTLTDVTVTDTGTEQPLGPCVINENPTVVALPTTLAPEDILYCEAYHLVNQADVDAGEYTNTAVGDSAETDPGEGDVTVKILQIPGISVVKTGTKVDNPPAGDNEGDQITYTFRVENTGTVTLNNVTIADAIPGVVITGGPIASMAPGDVDTTTFTAVYTVTQADIDNGSFTNDATVTGLTPQDAPVTDGDDDTQNFTQNPGIELIKTGSFNDENGDTFGDVGETITYAFTVTNTGNVTLTNITLADLATGVTITGGPIASLDPGDSDSTTFTGTYAITQTDIDAGHFYNEAEVSGEDPGGDPVTDDDDHDEPIGQNPGIEIIKTGSLDMNVVGDPGIAEVGDEINYTFTVTNTGNVTLTNVTVNDLVGGISVSGGPVTLDPGEVDTLTFTAVYALTQADIDAGTFYNNAEARGTDPGGNPVTDEDDHTEPISREPGIELVKTGTLDMTVVEPNTRADVGDQINYVFAVTNTGNVTLTNISITDTLAGVTISGTIASLAPGATDNTSISGVYDLTQADINAGQVDNDATVTGDEPGGGTVTDDDDDSVSITDVPEIQLIKTGTYVDDATPGDNAGDTITYSFTVTNTGNVTLTNITLSDTVGGVTITGGPILSLAPGASDSTTFTGTYTITQADVDAGHFYNQATVTGTDPSSNPVTDDDDHDEPIAQTPGIDLVKTGTLDMTIVAPNTRADVGDQITYTFVVTNTGNVTLDNITIDDAIPGVAFTGGPITLAPGASDSTTFTAVYTLTVADLDAGTFTNTATVSGDDPNDNPVTDSDPDTQTLPAVPSIQLEKTGTIDDTVVAPDGRVDAGDQINYVFTVTNTGNVTLTNITVSDTVGGVTVSGTIASLAPGAVDSTSITGVYTLTQADVDAGTFHNEADVEGTDPNDTVVTDDDDDDQTLVDVPSIDLQKDGTLDDTVIAPTGQVNAGDQINYVFTVTNTGNVTLYDITLSDTVGGVTITGGPIASLAPGASDNTTFTGVYTLTQDDVDAGTFLNEAEVSGDDPSDNPVTDDDDDTQSFTPVPSIDLQKTGTLDPTIVPLNSRPDEGDVINYAFRVENTGNVTLYNIVVTDTIGGVTITGGPIASLAPGAVDDTTYTGSYTLTLADVDAGTFYNEANVSGTDPNSTVVTDDDDDTQNLIDDGTLGIAKDVIADPAEVSPGVWHFTYQLYIENAGNVTLRDIQVSDDLAAVFGGMYFAVLEVRSTDFTLNAGFDGDNDTNLLAGTDVLLPGEYGYIEIDVEFIPENRGPFLNTAVVTGTNPSDEEISDDSQDGVDPDPDRDDDPTNNNDPTPLDFPPYIFDPPFGIKVYDNAGLPLLEWSMIWINASNIVTLRAQVSDPIPANSRFYNDGIPSGYALPPGPHPDQTTTNGVVCTPEEGYAGTSTTTTYCYYEGPTLEYPRGRIVWEGTLGPDLGATNADEASNEIYISFNVRVNNIEQDVNNTGEIGADLDGDGDIEGEEIVVADARRTWYADVLPDTGFAPGEITVLPIQPLEKQYDSSGIVMEIPALGIQTNVITVPFIDGNWDVTWLGNDVGYLEGSAYPTWQGNTVLTAHNWTALNQPGIFADIADLQYGDQILIHAFGMTYVYEVRSERYVTNSDLSTVFQHEELDWVTLMTCYGFDEDTGSYHYRYLVRAVLVLVK